MRCKDCSTRSNGTTAQARRARRGRVLKCEKCGAPILPELRESGLNAGDSTLDHLTRFGLAITGAPLLEPKPEASKRCAES
jgi:hypothetical protein